MKSNSFKEMSADDLSVLSEEVTTGKTTSVSENDPPKNSDFQASVGLKVTFY